MPLSGIEKLRLRGNEAFKKKKFAAAIRDYTLAIELYSKAETDYAPDGDDGVDLDLLLKVHNNRSLAHFKLANYEDCIFDTTTVINLTAADEDGELGAMRSKALFRRGEARFKRMEKGDLEGARDDYIQSLKAKDCQDQTKTTKALEDVEKLMKGLSLSKGSDLKSGDRKSGDRKSGDRKSGDCKSGEGKVGAGTKFVRGSSFEDEMERKGGGVAGTVKVGKNVVKMGFSGGVKKNVVERKVEGVVGGEGKHRSNGVKNHCEGSKVDNGGNKNAKNTNKEDNRDAKSKNFDANEKCNSGNDDDGDDDDGDDDDGDGDDDKANSRICQAEATPVSSNNPSPTSSVTTPPRPPAIPSLSQQKNLVSKLLTQSYTSIAPGDVWCLVEGEWWNRWCESVGYNGVGCWEGVVDEDEDGEEKKTDKKSSNEVNGTAIGLQDDTGNVSGAGEGMDKLGEIDNTKLLRPPPAGKDAAAIAAAARSANSLSSYLPVPPTGMTTTAVSTYLKFNITPNHQYCPLPLAAWTLLKKWYGGGPKIERAMETWPTSGVCGEGRRVAIRLYPEKLIVDSTSPTTKTIPTTDTNTCTNSDTKEADAVTTKTCGACFTPNVTRSCSLCKQAHYCDQTCQKSHWLFHKMHCKSVADEDSDDTRSRLPSGRRGKVGLQNLGNTCFMNSALQCLSHTRVLTAFFLRGGWEDLVNKGSWEGSGGRLVEEYANLMKNLWFGEKRSVAPTLFKREMSKFNSQFRGLQQQDSQELIQILLDGLHEDLNQIVKKPYVSPTSCDGLGRLLAPSSASNWDKHLLRNSSIINDNFFGQFQSTLVCPDCNAVSVSFDPCAMLTLSMVDTVVVYVTLFKYKERSVKGKGKGKFWREEDQEGDFEDVLREKPKRYGLTVKRGGTVMDLKKALSLQAYGTDKFWENLMFARIGPPKDNEDGPRVINNYIDEDMDRKPILTATGKFEGGIQQHVLHAYESHLFTSAAKAVHISLQVAKEEDGSFLGVPIFTSIPETATCAQVRLHVLKAIYYLRDAVGPSDTTKGNYADEQNLVVEGEVWCLGSVDGVKKSSFDKPEVYEETPLPAPKAPSASLIEDDDSKIFKDWARDIHGKDIVDNICPVVVLVDPKVLPELDRGEEVLDVDLTAADYQEKMKKAISASTSGYDKAGSKTLYECLKHYGTPEKLTKGEEWYCSKCKAHVPALKTMAVRRLPNILLIHLKRFDWGNSRGRKISYLVDFPLEGLDMRASELLEEEFHVGGNAGNEIDATYDCFGVVNHMGQMGFGHYTAYAREIDADNSVKKEGWYCFNDSDCRPVHSEDVVSEAAYILFYRRREFT